MNQLLKSFRAEYLELILQFLWRQWSALGVAGHGEAEDDWVIDPEALLIFTATMGRYDARLFDEVLDWLSVNGQFVNIQRLKTMLKNEQFSGGPVLSAISCTMSRIGKRAKWHRLAESFETLSEQPLFLKEDGSALLQVLEKDPDFSQKGFSRDKADLRGYSQEFRADVQTNLLLKLRALFGVNARCEILLYLLTHKHGLPRDIARETYYFHRTIQDALLEMNRSWAVQSRKLGRERRYWMPVDPWKALISEDGGVPQWINWAPLFSALERIWLKCGGAQFGQLEEPLLVASVLKQLMIEVRPDIERAGFEHALSDERKYLGEQYTSAFLADIKRLLG